jgi:HTH-type transcriptional regulator, glycine betaine synthesis regulator
MKGYLWPPESPRGAEDHSRLPRWEAIAVDAVGNVIEFWGFKRNQGRLWAFLYLRAESYSAGQLEKELGLSKGAVSMLIRDLERWGVILRVRTPGEVAWHYRAETDLMKMVSRVIDEREAQFLARIQEDIGEARRLAVQEPGVPKDRLERLERMAALAEQTQRALRLFIKTARLDVGGMFGVFRDAALGRKTARNEDH